MLHLKNAKMLLSQSWLLLLTPFTEKEPCDLTNLMWPRHVCNTHDIWPLHTFSSAFIVYYRVRRSFSFSFETGEMWAETVSLITENNLKRNRRTLVLLTQRVSKRYVVFIIVWGEARLCRGIIRLWMWRGTLSVSHKEIQVSPKKPHPPF